MLQSGNVAIHLPWALASAAYAMAQTGEADEALSRVREVEQLLERHAARGIVGHRGWAYHAVSRACLLLGRLDEARRLGHHSIESSQRQPGFAAHGLLLLGDIATHPERFDAESGAAHYRGTGTRPSARHAPGYRPLPSRPRQTLPPYRPAGARPRESCHSDDDVPRDGHGFLARAGEADVTDRGDVKQRVRPGSKSSASVAEVPLPLLARADEVIE